MTTPAVTNPASTLLQDAAAAAQPTGQADANTIVTSAPVIGGAAPVANAPATAADPQPTIAGEHQAYLDAWATNPTQDAPVRTWLDASQRDTPQGQYLAAWHDTPPGDAAVDTPIDQAANAQANAAAISSLQAQATPAANTAGAPSGEEQPDQDSQQRQNNTY